MKLLHEVRETVQVLDTSQDRAHVLTDVREVVQVLDASQDRVHVLMDIRQGLPGARGPAGPPGGGGVSMIAGATLGGHRVVQTIANVGLMYASADQREDALRLVGVITSSVAAGEDVTVVTNGEVEEASWNWDTSKPVYLGLNGLLTQTVPEAPTAQFAVVVGMPTSAQSLFVKLREPIALA